MKKTILISLISISFTWVSAQQKALDLNVFYAVHNTTSGWDNYAGATHDKVLNNGLGLSINYYFLKDWSLGVGATYLKTSLLGWGDTPFTDLFTIRSEFKIRKHFTLNKALKIAPYVGTDISIYSSGIHENYARYVSLNLGALFEYSFSQNFGAFIGAKWNDITGSIDNYAIGEGAHNDPHPNYYLLYDPSPIELSVGLIITLVKKKSL